MKKCPPWRFRSALTRLVHAKADCAVAGFWLWQVKDMAEAVEWVKRCPNPMTGPSEIEIRPLFATADFGDAMTPEQAEREDRMRQVWPNGDASGCVRAERA